MLEIKLNKFLDDFTCEIKQTILAHFSDIHCNIFLHGVLYKLFNKSKYVY